MGRRLFCEISPFTYELSVWKQRSQRYLRWLLSWRRYARAKAAQSLPLVVYTHASLIRRTLGQVNMTLQENKAVNLALSAPRVDGVLIRPGETFSFWRLVGRTTKRRGYRDGLTLAGGKTAQGVGGGLCQFTNLLHWLALHSPLTVSEYHHHDQYDL
ncbi:MAG: VanW family protein, partial [Oscillospiraceae bacterium]|nr:VanW family protein [Oscillospiraceae bacterium]